MLSSVLAGEKTVEEIVINRASGTTRTGSSYPGVPGDGDRRAAKR